MDLFNLQQWLGFKQAGGDISTPAWLDQITIDSRNIHSPRSLFVALKGEKRDGHQFVHQAAQAGAKWALVSENWINPRQLSGMTLLRVPDPLKAFQEIVQVYRRQLPTKIIGITGSFGKTMVKDLLLQLLQTQLRAIASPESFNSQIGVPLSLLTIQKEHEIAIIEAAISQKNEIETHCRLIAPDFTLLTPLGKKHFATLEGFSTLTEEMAKFINVTAANGWSLLPSEPSISIQPIHENVRFDFWDQPQLYLPHASLLSSKEQPVLPYLLKFPDHTEFRGIVSSGHTYFLNLINMAVKAAWLMGVSGENICGVIKDFLPESTHTEMWKSPMGALFINEPYCSDPQSVDRALIHFNYANPEQRKIFFFGGMRGDPDNSHAYRRIGQALAQANLDHLVLYGSSSYQELVEEVKKHSPATTICNLFDQLEAFSFLREIIRTNDYVVIKGEKKIPLEKLTEFFHDSLSNNQCLINLAAIQNNIRMIRKQLSPGTRLMIMVKALAYGTDDVRLAKYLAMNEIDILGVSYVDEAVALKRAGVTQAIFAMNAAPYEAAKVVKWGVEVGISNKELIEELAKTASEQGKQVKVHLHVDTGMGRFGCRPEQVLEIAEAIKSYPELILEGIMTHFACAEDQKEDAFTRQQIDLFDSVIAQLKESGIEIKWKHAANSSATLRFKLPQYNMVRVGLAAYGLYLSEAVKQTLDLRLALSLTSRIVGINTCKKGETVSYSKSYEVEREEQRIAVLPIGYYDGLHRKYSGKSHVIIRGKQARMVGNICMDYMMVDITDIPEAQVGDKVLIFGQDEYGYYLSPEELASRGDSIIHELMTCLGPRIQRIFVDEESCQIR